MKFKINPKNGRKQFKIFISRAKERIESAQILLKKGNYNDAISRAYYAFFDAAHAALILKGITAKTHAGLFTLFNLHFVKTNKIPVKYVRFFREAKEAREEADYQILKKFTKKEAERIIETAKEFVKVIKEEFKK